jgi:hypothetical protein
MARKSLASRVISEMFGRVEPTPIWLTKFKYWFNRYSDIQTVDLTRSNYSLTRAIYYASTVTDREANKTYGEKFLLGAVFGKPIINAAAAFAFASPFEVIVKNGSKKENEATSKFVNDWISDNWKKIFNVARWTMRDGDSFLLVPENLTPRILSANRVEIKIDPLTGETTGYEVTNYVKEGDDMVKYLTIYSKTPPYKEVRKYTDQDKYEVVGGVQEETEETEEDGEKPLEICEFHNELDTDTLYGYSDYQNCFFLMANYHAVLENAIKNNIFNSNSIPYASGIEDQQKFLEANGVRQDDGTYKLEWNPDKTMVGGKDFKLAMLEGSKNAAESDKLLNLLFWLICQTSETPEFVMGTAVSSSKASVSEQLPVVVRKAKRKQTEFEEYFKNLVKLVCYQGSKTDDSILTDPEVELVPMKIVDDDMKLNLEIVKVLSEEGVITDKTKMLLLNMGEYVDDIDKEIKDARAENDKKKKEVDLYGQGTQNLPKLTPDGKGNYIDADGNTVDAKGNPVKVSSD